LEICDSEVIWIKTIGKWTVTPLGEVFSIENRWHGIEKVGGSKRVYYRLPPFNHFSV